MILVTGHRRENFGAGFERICQALAVLAEREDVQNVYPVHLNPNVQDPVRRLLGDRDNVHLIEPLDYLPFVALMDRASFLITDGISLLSWHRSRGATRISWRSAPPDLVACVDFRGLRRRAPGRSRHRGAVLREGFQARKGDSSRRCD